jgi:hypothetical protein
MSGSKSKLRICKASAHSVMIEHDPVEFESEPELVVEVGPNPEPMTLTPEGLIEQLASVLKGKRKKHKAEIVVSLMATLRLSLADLTSDE